MAKKLSLAKLKQKLQLDEHKMDKFLSYYHNGTPLNDEEAAMLEKYRKAWSWLSMGRTFEATISLVMKEYNIQERQARYIISEAVFLHGQTSRLDKAGKKVASANFYRLLAQLAMMKEDYDAAGKLTEKADKLEGLMDDETVGMNPDDFMKPGKFVFINNVNILKQNLKQQMEDDE
ncbi:hypothetical protein LX87_04097 [Larkinella arboricola]|uniref:Uncharacterized protein n=1 Tax=Larkinella arboricola TaxID=643671 RepID=A0A327WSA5_LARAB|nr:hypothetical protein [Larkinella arboricola]RAJ94212.1 hypothetical protein LX87_04097 [Larkinella arboricola]